MFLFHYRKTAALLIILAGFGTALFLTAGGDDSSKNGLITLDLKDQNNSSLEFTKNYLNSGLNYQGDATKSSFSNLTEVAAEAYLAELIGRNPNGLQLKDNKQTLNIPGEEALGKIIQDRLNQSFEWPSFQIQDLNIAADNSNSAKLKYLSAIKSVLEKKRKNLEAELEGLNNFFKKGGTGDLEKILVSLKKQIAALQEIPVPSKNSAFHLNLVNAWQYQAAIYEAVLNLETDPLRALLAINEVAKSTQEFQDINLAAQKEYEALKS